MIIDWITIVLFALILIVLIVHEIRLDRIDKKE